LDKELDVDFGGTDVNYIQLFTKIPSYFWLRQFGCAYTETFLLVKTTISSMDKCSSLNLQTDIMTE